MAEKQFQRKTKSLSARVLYKLILTTVEPNGQAKMLAESGHSSGPVLGDCFGSSKHSVADIR